MSARPRPVLRALARRVGILPGYREAGSGALRRTSDATRTALLSALGLDAGTEAAARRTLAALDAAARERALEPVAVVELGARWRPRLRRGTAPRGPVFVELEVREESGAMHERAGRGRVDARGAIVAPALPPLGAGVHSARVRVRGARRAVEAEQTLIVAPQRALEPRDLGLEAAFGIQANLWSVRGARGIGIGNLSDLAALGRFAASAGAAFVGTSPLFAVRNVPPEISPYTPFTRLFHDPIYLDPEAIPGFASCPEARVFLEDDERRRELERLRQADRLEHDAIARFQRPVLQALWLHAGRGTRELHAPLEPDRARLLVHFATFQALEEHFASGGRARDWRVWPAPFREPDSVAVRSFRTEHAARVEYFAWVERETSRQLADAHATVRRAGARLGVYTDLPLGIVASGFDSWAFPKLFVDGVSLGAPPDPFAAEGQDWQLPPLDPTRLRESGYRYLRQVLETALAQASMLRIDHALGLERQFWIPKGEPASSGAYVAFPRDELLALLALESRRRGALLVAEDLGTVPDGFREALERRGLLGSGVLYFERDRRGAFKPARAWSPRALATANTHDLVPLEGWRIGRDLEILRATRLLASDAALARAREVRAEEVRALVARLVAEGLLAEGAPPDGVALRRAVYAFLARTRAPLVGIALDDLAGEVEPANLPGVSPRRWPSWTRRMQRSLAEIAGDADSRATLDAVRAERTQSPGTPGGPRSASAGRTRGGTG
jgi:4-alpha-glucanotransferase